MGFHMKQSALLLAAAMALLGNAMAVTNDSLDDLIDDRVLSSGNSTASQQEAHCTDLPANPSALERAILEACVARPNHAAAPGRTTSRSFPLRQMESGDLERTDLGGLSAALSAPPGMQLMVSPDDLSFFMARAETDPAHLDINNINSLQIRQALAEIIIANAIIYFDGGYSIVSADVGQTENSIDITLSTEVQARLVVADGDGVSGTPAIPTVTPVGAVVADPLRIKATGIQASISLAGSGDDTRVIIDASAPNGIDINLSGSKIGTAPAVLNDDQSLAGGFFRSNATLTGPTSTFMEFGADSRLEIAPGMTLTSTITKPNANTPLVTLNGRLGRVSLRDMSLIDSSSKARMHIGAYTIYNLEMDNMKIYFDREVIRIDTGNSIAALHSSIEQLRFGNPPPIGDMDMMVSAPNTQVLIWAH